MKRSKSLARKHDAESRPASANLRSLPRTAGADLFVPRPVMTVKDVSDYLRVHSSTISRLLKRGQLPAFKVGSDWRFNIEAIDQWRLAQATPPAGGSSEIKR